MLSISSNASLPWPIIPPTHCGAPISDDAHTISCELAASESAASVAVETERYTPSLDALDDESFNFEDEERRFLESPIVSSLFPYSSTAPRLAGQPEYLCADAEDPPFCFTNEDSSASILVPFPPSTDTDTANFATFDAAALDARARFPGIALHPPADGDVEQPLRPFVDAETCFIRELPDPALLAPPATSVGGEVLRAEEYIVMREGYSFEVENEYAYDDAYADEEEEGDEEYADEDGGEYDDGDDAGQEEGGPWYDGSEAPTWERCAYEDEDAFMPSPYDNDDGDNDGSSRSTSRTLSTFASSLCLSTLFAGPIRAEADVLSASLLVLASHEPVLLVSSTTIAQSARPTPRVTPNDDADIAYAGLVPSVVLYPSPSPDNEYHGFSVPSDFDLLYAPPVGSMGRMEDDWVAYHFPHGESAAPANVEPEPELEAEVDGWEEVDWPGRIGYPTPLQKSKSRRGQAKVEFERLEEEAGEEKGQVMRSWSLRKSKRAGAGPRRWLWKNF